MDFKLFVQYSIDALSLGSVFALVALGIALIFGILSLVNFAHGELIVAGAYAVVILDRSSLSVIILGAILCSVVIAILMDRVALRPLRQATAGTLMIASFAVSFGLQNVAIAVFGSRPRAVSTPAFVTEFFVIGDLRIPKLHVGTVVITTVALVCLTAFLKNTSIGIQMRAAAEDFRMAELLGVPANRVIGTAFAISGILAGAVALLTVAGSGAASPGMGLAPLLAGVVATVIGGWGSLLGAVAGGYILGCLTVVLQVGLPEDIRVYREAIVFGIVFSILVFKPDGLLGKQSKMVRV